MVRKTTQLIMNGLIFDVWVQIYKYVPLLVRVEHCLFLNKEHFNTVVYSIKCMKRIQCMLSEGWCRASVELLLKVMASMDMTHQKISIDAQINLFPPLIGWVAFMKLQNHFDCMCFVLEENTNGWLLEVKTRKRVEKRLLHEKIVNNSMLKCLLPKKIL
jgi:hypothetical protein